MAASDELQELVGWSESPTDAGAIQSALTRIWRDASGTHPRSDGRSGLAGGVVRTRVANLIAFSPTPDDAEHSMAVLRELALRHPIRSLLFSPYPDPSTAGLGATVRAFCRGSTGGSICFEQIHVTASGENGQRLASIASQLMVHDLPVLFWWTSGSPFGSAAFRGLAELADLLIFDSGELNNPVEGIAALADGPGRLEAQPAIADLNWNRLGDWRELIAQFFDHEEARLALEQVREVEIEVAAANGSVLSAQALLLIGWLGSRLDWSFLSGRTAGIGHHIRFRRTRAAIDVRLIPSASASSRAGAVCAVRIVAGANAAEHRFCLESEADQPHATATADREGGHSNCRCFALQERSTADLLSEELDTFGREHALDESLEFAAQVAHRLSSTASPRRLASPEGGRRGGAKPPKR